MVAAGVCYAVGHPGRRRWPSPSSVSRSTGSGTASTAPWRRVRGTSGRATGSTSTMCSTPWGSSSSSADSSRADSSASCRLPAFLSRTPAEHRDRAGHARARHLPNLLLEVRADRAPAAAGGGHAAALNSPWSTIAGHRFLLFDIGLAIGAVGILITFVVAAVQTRESSMRWNRCLAVAFRLKPEATGRESYNGRICKLMSARNFRAKAGSHKVGVTVRKPQASGRRVASGFSRKAVAVVGMIPSWF